MEKQPLEGESKELNLTAIILEQFFTASINQLTTASLNLLLLWQSADY